MTAREIIIPAFCLGKECKHFEYMGNLGPGCVTRMQNVAEMVWTRIDKVRRCPYPGKVSAGKNHKKGE